MLHFSGSKYALGGSPYDEADSGYGPNAVHPSRSHDGTLDNSLSLGAEGGGVGGRLLSYGSSPASPLGAGEGGSAKRRYE